MSYHELTEKIHEDYPKIDNTDKIIRQWLTEKIESCPMGYKIVSAHFGLTKNSCKCGKTRKERDYWSSDYRSASWCLQNGDFCPSCGEKLGAV